MAVKLQRFTVSLLCGVTIAVGVSFGADSQPKRSLELRVTLEISAKKQGESTKNEIPDFELRVANQGSAVVSLLCNPNLLPGAEFSVTPKEGVIVREENYFPNVDELRYTIEPGKSLLIKLSLDRIVRFERSGMYQVNYKIPLHYFRVGIDDGRRDVSGVVLHNLIAEGAVEVSVAINDLSTKAGLHQRPEFDPENSTLRVEAS